MLNHQIMQAKIKLAELEKDYKENKIKLMRIFHELQNNINPYFGDDIVNIKAEEIEQAGDELLKLRYVMLEQQAVISQIKSDLGGV